MNKNPKTGAALLWNGEKVKDVKFGYVVQTPNESQPMYWYNWEISKQVENGISSGNFATIPAVQITAKSGETFCIANIAGSGVKKMELGGMWNSQVGHLSLDGKFTEHEDLAIYEYNHMNYMVYHAGLEKWQKENFPEVFAKMEALRKVAQSASRPTETKEFTPGAVIDGNSILAGRKQGISGTTSLHEKFRKGKQR